MIRMLKVLVLATAVVALSTVIVASASAHGHGGGHGGHAGHGGFHGHHGFHGHSSVVVGLGFGSPWWGWPGYGYWPAYYDYPPAYYSPYPPGYAYNGSTSVTPAHQCRDYHGDATIDASGAPFYGRACLEADGRWHVAS